MEKNLIKKILDGLNDEYKEIVWVMQTYETLITFTKLHEKKC